MNWKRGSWLWVFALLLATSCVSRKKYDELDALRSRLQSMVDKGKRDISDLQTERDSLSQALSARQDQVEVLRQDTVILAGAVDSLTLMVTDLTKDITDLTAQIQQTEEECGQVKENYKQLKSNSSQKLQEMMGRLEKLQRSLRSREMRLKMVQTALRNRDSLMTRLRNRIANALLGFQDQGFSVKVDEGKVYVSLSNKLLFESGSTQLDKEGTQALKDLAGTLLEQKDITIMVEGHTDNIPVSNLGDINDNWDLSVMRSTEVVRVLVGEGIEPTRVVPSGRSEYLPLEYADTPEARALNRRTEIIISPRLNELFKLISERSGRPSAP